MIGDLLYCALFAILSCLTVTSILSEVLLTRRESRKNIAVSSQSNLRRAESKDWPYNSPQSRCWMCRDQGRVFASTLEERLHEIVEAHLHEVAFSGGGVPFSWQDLGAKTYSRDCYSESSYCSRICSASPVVVLVLYSSHGDGKGFRN